MTALSWEEFGRHINRCQCGHASYQHRSTWTDADGLLRGWSCVMHGCDCQAFKSSPLPEESKS